MSDTEKTMVKGTDFVANEIYSAHLGKSDALRFAASNTMTRTAVHQRMHMKNLIELSANRFEWKNLPEEIDVRYLEMSLLYRALSVFFKDPGTGMYFALRGTPAGNWDVYENPTEFVVTGPQFNGRRLSATRTYHQDSATDDIVMNEADCVPIWANYTRTPDMDVVLLYAYKLAELDVTIEINSRNARRNKIAVADENMVLTATNVNRQIDEGNNFINVKPSALGSMPVALDLGINPDSLEKLHILKVRQFNEAMGMLGINNANQDKKERLVASEVDANNEQVSANRNVALNQRQEAAKLINKLYGLDIEVCFKSDEEMQKMVEASPSNPNNKPEGDAE